MACFKVPAPWRSQVLAVDAGGSLAVYSMDTGRLVAVAQLAHEPIIDLSPCLDQPDTYAAVTGSGLQVWKLHRSLEYSVTSDGHTKVVVAVHACGGGSHVGGNIQCCAHLVSSGHETLKS